MSTDMHRINSTHTKNDILDAAEKLFADKGFDGTGIMEIAREAGMPKSLIYYYFKNKEDILHELIDSLIRETVDLKVSAVADEHPEDMLTKEGLSRFLHIMYDFYDKRKGMYKIIHQEALKKEFIGNLLMQIQISQKASIDYFKEAGMKINEKDMKMGHFFMVAMPFMSFIVYKDKWCQSNDCDPKELREKFFDLITDMMTLLISKNVSGS
jgi:AcrR family transcriptional regulator